MSIWHHVNWYVSECGSQCLLGELSCTFPWRRPEVSQGLLLIGLINSVRLVWAPPCCSHNRLLICSAKYLELPGALQVFYSQGCDYFTNELPLESTGTAAIQFSCSCNPSASCLWPRAGTLYIQSATSTGFPTKSTTPLAMADQSSRPLAPGQPAFAAHDASMPNSHPVEAGSIG